MERYDRLRAEGADPVEAMRRVAPALTPRRCGPGSRAWPDRAALTEQAATRRRGVAEITRYRGETATTQPDTAQRAVSYTHLRAHETRHDLVCRLLLEK